MFVGDGIGAASDLKLVCNTWIASLTAGTAQSLSLARTFGLDPRLFLDVIAGSASDSPYAHVKGATLLDGDRAPQFALDALLKDLRLAQSTELGAHQARGDQLRDLHGVQCRALAQVVVADEQREATAVRHTLVLTDAANV